MQGPNVGFVCEEGIAPGLFNGGSELDPSGAGCRIRFLEIRDSGASLRREELAGVFGKVAFYNLSSHDISGLSQASAPFDALFVSADDIPRLCHALFPPANILVKNKPSFLYCASINPRARARMLRFGFDDIFFSKMTPSEISLRMKAAIDRSNTANTGSLIIGKEDWIAFLDNHVSGELSRRQSEIVQMLLAAGARGASFTELATYDFTAQSYRISSLKVTVSRIRKRLKKCSIETVSGRSYRLKF